MLEPMDFIRIIEASAVKTGAGYIDAVVDYCQKNGIEIETAAAIIKSSPLIKSKIQQEAEDLNIIAKTSKLPID